MSTRAPFTASLALAGALVLGLSGCSIVEDWGLLGSTDSSVDELNPEGIASEPSSEGADVANGAGSASNGDLSVPTCDTMYSVELTTALLAELRTNFGDTSEGAVGFGTINQDLVPLLKNTRSDLKISCNWYLPPGGSVSVTSVAILTSATMQTVSNTLRALGAASAEAGGGTLYTIAQATAEASVDYGSNEAHFLVDVPCPTSVPEESCGVWITTNYVFGDAQPLTLDAARTLGVYRQ